MRLTPDDLPRRWDHLAAAVLGFSDAQPSGDVAHEWAVRWPDSAIEACPSEGYARAIRRRHGSDAQLVTRTITRGPWRAANPTTSKEQA